MTPEHASAAPTSETGALPPEAFEGARRKLQSLEENIRRVIVGKEEATRMALLPLLCRGHLLLEDVPGTGKTTLAKAIARSIGGEFKRVQFTPDLLPLDVTGTSMFNQKTQEFEFLPGPVFTNILLADEINRATPRTQSALLESMEEFQVSIEGHTRKLADAFCVLATMNPVEQTGTFPLPETQLDRFFLKIWLGYPTESEEVQIFDRQAQVHPLESLRAVATLDDVRELRQAALKIFVHSSIKNYCARLARATRSHPDVVLGASPRGTLCLIRAAQGFALLVGRTFVTPDHVKRVARAVLGHRLILKPQAALRGVTDEMVLREVMSKVDVPIGAE